MFIVRRSRTRSCRSLLARFDPAENSPRRNALGFRSGNGAERRLRPCTHKGRHGYSQSNTADEVPLGKLAKESSHWHCACLPGNKTVNVVVWKVRNDLKRNFYAKLTLHPLERRRRFRV